MLDNNVKIKRGSLLVDKKKALKLQSKFEAKVCWMDTKELTQGMSVIIQFGTLRVFGEVVEIMSKLEMSTSDLVKVNIISTNDIGYVKISVEKEIPIVSYAKNNSIGRFIIINPITNFTSAVGFVN